MWKEKQERKEKGKKRLEEISQDEREKIREEERINCIIVGYDRDDNQIINVNIFC